jgi:hypothetical protein
MIGFVPFARLNVHFDFGRSDNNCFAHLEIWFNRRVLSSDRIQLLCPQPLCPFGQAGYPWSPALTDSPTLVRNMSEIVRRTGAFLGEQCCLSFARIILKVKRSVHRD